MKYSEENDDTFDGIGLLKREIGQCIRSEKTFPKTFFFNEGFPKPKFKITIEKIEEDFVIDDHGTKCIRDKSDSE